MPKDKQLHQLARDNGYTLTIKDNVDSHSILFRFETAIQGEKDDVATYRTGIIEIYGALWKADYNFDRLYDCVIDRFQQIIKES